MIQPQELRIGNYYQGASRGNIEIVTWKTLRDLSEGKLNLLPITLTEEILLNFGFYEIYKSEFSIRYGIENFDEIEFKWNKTFGWNFYYKTFCIEGIKYVHQLQNLFFSLTGKELPF